MRYNRLEKEVFEWMVSEYYDRVYRTALYYLKNSSDAQDITQDVFLKALEKIDFSQTDKSKFPILFIMAKNLSLNKLKNKGHQESDIVDWEITSGYLDPEHEIMAREDIVAIEKAVAELKDGEREIILLKHFQDCSYAEISEILHIPKGTVMSRLYNARQSLKAILEGVGYGKEL